MADLIKGIDISVIQGNVDFKAVAESGVQFVICRCGVGNNGTDTKYKQYMAQARAAGLKVMAYNFVFPLPPQANQPTRDPKIQAKMHVEAAGGELAACDLEWPPPEQWNKWGCTGPQISQWTIDYLEEYERLSGIRPVVYVYPYFAKAINLPDWFGEKYKLWIASYTSTPAIPHPWKDWVIWQDTGGGGKLPSGVAVDTDKIRDLSLWSSTVTTPTPETAPAPEPAPITVASPSSPSMLEPTPAPVIPVVEAEADKSSNFFLFAWNALVGLYNKFLKK